MPINPNIALGVQPMQLQLPDPNSGVNALARALQIKGLSDESRARSQALAETNALNEAYRGALGQDGALDRNRLMQTLAERNLGSRIPALQKQFADADKATADVTKAKAETENKSLETALKRAEHVSSVLSLAKDPQSYATVRAVIKNQFGQDLPEQFDPNMVSALVAQGQTLTQKLADLRAQQGQAITMRGQDMQAQTSTENNKRTVGASMANAAATREIANATREAALIGANLKNEELRGKLQDRQRQKNAGIASIATQIGVIDKALTHPGRAAATGLSGTIDPRNYVPGTDATDFRTVLDQIGGTAFLQAFESLKGGGQITEVEGRKATDAIARLNRAQSDSEFEASLRDLREVMTRGYERAAGKQFDRPAPSGGGQSKPASGQSGGLTPQEQKELADLRARFGKK